MLRPPHIAFGLVLAAAIGGCALEPMPLDDAELVTLAAARAVQVTAEQQPLTGAITLYEAMARALKYNLDHRVEMMQTALRDSELHLVSRDMLPKAVANATHSTRSKDLALGHLDFPTGTIVQPISTSQDLTQDVGDITFSWNILDFALSYVRARQSADKYLIAEEATRKVVQAIIEDTRTAYWRAVSAERMVGRIKGIEARAQKAIGGAQALQKSGDMAPTSALTFERELVQIKHASRQLVGELDVARAQLAALINIEPGVNFSLAGGQGELRPVMLELSGQEMIAEALFNRPELRDIAYRRRINDAELYAAFLELLPGAQLFVAENGSSNEFLLNNQWLTVGVTAAENLIKVFQLPAKRRVIEAQDEVLDTRQLATTMVIMTQVYVSRTRYHHFTKALATANDYFDVQTKLVEELRAQAAADRVGEQTLIREEMSVLLAELKRDIAFANLQNSAANVFVSMGLDLQTNELKRSMSVKELAAHLRSAWADRAAVSPRGKYLMELAAAKAEEKRRQEDAARQARLEAALKARQEAIAREAEADARRGGGLKDFGGSLKDYGGSLKDQAPSSRQSKPYTGVK